MRNERPRDRYGRPLRRASRGERTDCGETFEGPRSVDEARRLGIALFDERRFFEAHEMFEQIWKADGVESADRAFWKGVTQVAVGCCHVQRGNTRGALALLERAVGHLRGYPTPHHGIETGALIEVAQTVAGRVEREGASSDLDFPGFPSRDR